MAAARMLVVDDQPAIVSLVEVILAQQDYEILGETSPRRALDLVRAGRHVDLIISDVVMPEMTGPELVREIQRVSPAMHAVLMSAFARTEDLPPDVPLLHKPFSAADLLSTVERVLKDATHLLRKKESGH